MLVDFSYEKTRTILIKHYQHSSQPQVKWRRILKYKLSLL